MRRQSLRCVHKSSVYCVIDEYASHSAHPDHSVIEDIECCSVFIQGNELLHLKSGKIILQKMGRSHEPYRRIRILNKGLYRCRHLSVNRRKDRLESAGWLVILGELYQCIYIYITVGRFENLRRVTAHRLHRDPHEIVLLCIKSHSVYGRHPQSVTRILMQTLNLVIRKGRQITCAEMLLKFVDIVTIEASESTYPYMSLGILRKSGNPLVGYVTSNDRSLDIQTLHIVLVYCTRSSQTA